MRPTLTPIRHLVFITCLSTSVMGYTFNSSTTEKQANTSIEELYHRLNDMPNSSMSTRIDWISRQFLGQPYQLGALGEGSQALYDQFPQYRADAFDCDTYVNTVLALALANSLPSFQQCIKNTRYKNGNVSYLDRNHFTGLDWNQNNQQRGFLKDITSGFKNQNHQSVVKRAEAVINKPNWYAHKTIATIRLEHANPNTAAEQLAKLKNEGAKQAITAETVPYLPFTALFPEKNKPDMHLFAQIPNGAIIEIVRPNWDLNQQIGTALNISHLGFAIRNKGQLYFRQASSEYGKVVDVPLIKYLEKAQNSPTIKGINIQVVLPQKPLTDCSLSVHD